ncbi:MAG TPA: hypothetical protein VII39_00110 [Bradyrhizobium sp.]
MANRATKFVSAIFVGAIVGIPVSTLAKDAAGGADVSTPDSITSAATSSTECLTTPSRESSQGQHWFYRMEPGTNKRCWFLRDQAERTSQAASPRSGSSQSPSLNAAQSLSVTPPPAPRAFAKSARASRSLSNARAELGARPIVAESPGVTVPKEPVFITTGSAGVTGGASAGTDAIPGASATLTSTESTDRSLTGLSPDATPADGSSEGSDPMTGLSQSSAPEMPAMAMPQEKASASLQVLFLVILGALAFAGIMASLIHRMARIWGRRHARFRRSSIWVDLKGERRDSWSAGTAAAPGRSQDRRPAGAQRDGHSGQIKRFLAQITKPAASKSKKRVSAKTQAGSATRVRTPSARRGVRASAARP